MYMVILRNTMLFHDYHDFEKVNSRENSLCIIINDFVNGQLMKTNLWNLLDGHFPN